jgi:hypothetical protein
MKKFGRCGNGAVDETESWRFSTIDELTEVVRSFDCEVCAVMTGPCVLQKNPNRAYGQGFLVFAGDFPASDLNMLSPRHRIRRRSIRNPGCHVATRRLAVPANFANRLLAYERAIR